MTEFTDRIRAWWKDTAHAPTVRKIADMVEASGISNDRFPARVAATPFEAGTSYFGLRLSGFHLVDARTFATQRLPLCVCLAEFESGGERRTIPFSIGPDIIRKRLAEAGVTADLGKPVWIEMRDIPIVRPTPVNDANLSLYAGLFSVPGDDLVKTLLNLVGTVGTALSQPAVGPVLKVADTVYGSFGALLGFSQVQQVAAALIGTALTERGSGYLLIANTVPENFDVGQAAVVDGRLHWPKSQGGGAVVEFDHVLLALEHYATITEKNTGLADALFGKPWAAVRAAKKLDAANDALERLRDTIAASTEITEDDRLRLLVAYAGAAGKLNDARWGTQTASGQQADRAGSTRGLSEIGFLEKLDIAASRASDDQAVAGLLRAAATGLAKMPALPDVHSTDIAATRAGDEQAILAAARSVVLPKRGSGTNLRRASVTVAQAFALSET